MCPRADPGRTTIDQGLSAPGLQLPRSRTTSLANASQKIGPWGPVTAHLCPKLLSGSVAGPDRRSCRSAWVQKISGTLSRCLLSCAKDLCSPTACNHTVTASAVPASGGETAGEEP